MFLFELISVRGRNKERTAQRTGGGAAATNEKVGYVPRSNLANMKASGLSGTGGSRKGKEELDEESKAGLQRVQANDREIDQGINSISNTLDNLTGIAGQMKEEVYSLLTSLVVFFSFIARNDRNMLLFSCRYFVKQTQSQNKKLEQIENNIQKASEKQAVVNVRQKRYLN